MASTENGPPEPPVNLKATAIERQPHSATELFPVVPTPQSLHLQPQAPADQRTKVLCPPAEKPVTPPMMLEFTMAIFALCWLAVMSVAYLMTVGLIRPGRRQEELLMVPIKMDSDADPRRRRQQVPARKEAA